MNLGEGQVLTFSVGQTGSTPKTGFSTNGNPQTHISEDDVKVQLSEARSLRHLAAGEIQGIFSVISPKEPKLQPACTQRKIWAMASHQAKQE